jgi:hypothetical protein
MKAISKFFYHPVLVLSLMVASVISLTACGGNNSSSTTTSPTLNLNAAMMSYIANGSSNQGVIGGACQGTIKFTYSPTYSGKTVDGRAAAVVDYTETDTLASSSPAFCSKLYSSDGSKVSKIYYDPTTLLPITSGSNPQGVVYSNQQSPPSSVTNGSTGTLFTYVDYAGTSSPVTKGPLTWMVTADSPTTLLFTRTDDAQNASSGVLEYTSSKTYRINANNTLTNLYKVIKTPNAFTGGLGDLSITETYQQ